jgi:hypothetical protein
MTTAFVRPSAQHDPANILSASSESGITVAQPLASSSNAGSLRLRTSGIPTAAVSLDVKLQTGGNPSGYAIAASGGQGAGAAVIYKATSDGSSSYRGYIDTPYLVRVDYPVAYGTGLGRPSTPRTLANGYLGFAVGNNTAVASTLSFTYVTPQNVATTVDISASTRTNDYQPDLVVLPSGRLIVIGFIGTTLTRYHSDDNGATWSTGVSVGLVSGTLDMISLEYSEDMLTMVVAASDGGTATDVRVSQDEGYNWTSVDTSLTLRNVRTCVTTTGKILALHSTSTPLVYEIAPGGGFGSATVDPGITVAAGASKVALCARDDGTVWAFVTNSAAGTRVDIDASVSLDGGVTWSDPTATLKIMDLDSNLTNAGYRCITAGEWCGKVIILGQTQTATGSPYAIHMLTFGGWESVTEGDTPGSAVKPYNHCMIPVDYPDALATPWTRTNAGAGATVTNKGALKFVATGADNTYFDAPTAVIAATNPGGSYRMRFRSRVTSGGSVTNMDAGFRFAVSDGVNRQGIQLCMSATQFKVLDLSGTPVSNTFTVDMTKVTDFLFAFLHDGASGTTGQLSGWYKQDADTTWTVIVAAAAIPEAVGATSQLWIGGTASNAATWSCYYFGLSDNSNGIDAGFTNPTDLRGRSLASHADFYLATGIHLGGRSAAGVAGDAYTVSSTYNYAKEDIWRELRPSRKVHSSADNASWNVVFDAGSADTFRGNVAALFGTNFRTATLQLHTADSWASPSVSVSLNATLVTSTVSLAGPGYVGPAVSLNWRPGQYRSDGDAHRFFVEFATGGAVYEITDNDEDRLYIDGVDLSAASGTFRIFSDRMAATFNFAQYRYMRLLVGAQKTPTGDACYHVGTLIVDKLFTPARQYTEGFTDRIEPNVVAFETDAGYSSRARMGPRKYSTAIQWDGLNRLNATTADTERRIASFYAACEGNQTPIVFWRDTSDVSTLSLVTIEGTYAAPNSRGELSTAVARIDVLELTEYL